jgi:hypothetical protein
VAGDGRSGLNYNRGMDSWNAFVASVAGDGRSGLDFYTFVLS